MGDERSPLDDDLEALIAAGADPRRARVQDGRTFIDAHVYRGYSLRALVAAGGIGAVLCISAVLGYSAFYGLSLVSEHDRSIAAGVRGAGIDLGKLSSADIAARLTYSAEDGHILVDAIGDVSSRAAIDELIAWLRSLDPSQRRLAFASLRKAVAASVNSPAKASVFGAFADMSDDAANRLAAVAHDASAFSDILLRLAVLASPIDRQRFELWGVINSRNFPAPNALGLVSRLASAHPSRLDALAAWADDKPLPNCAPTYLRPLACEARWDTSVRCPVRTYPTAGPPRCVAIPADGTFVK